MKIVFTIPGAPRGKARPRVVRTKNGGSVSFTPDKTVAYKDDAQVVDMVILKRYIDGAGETMVRIEG